jgi:phage shock protein C
MQTAKANLFTRDDTFFGVCQGLGEDLGIRPDLIRLSLVVPLFFFPVQTLVAYLAAGVLVLALRFLLPDRTAAAKPQAESVEAVEPEALPLAA